MLGRKLAGVMGALLIALNTGQLAAQGNAPRAVAADLFTRLERTDWAGAASLVLPASHQRLRDIAIFTTYMDYATEHGSGSGGATLEDVPGPGEIAPYASRPIEGLAGIRTFGELAALPSETFLARWFESLDEELGISGIPRVIVDVVVEGDSLAHVLYRAHYTASIGRGRLNLGNPPPLDESVQVLTLRRAGNSWRAYLNGELVHHSPLMQIRTDAQ